MPIRLSGMASGLDTDTIVKELVSAYSTRKDNIVKQQTKLEWTQDAWKDMNTKIYSFYSKRLSQMRFSGSYSKKTSSVSNTSVAKITASSDAVNGTQTLKVKQLATSGYLTGGKISGTDGAKVKGSSKLSDVAGLENADELGSIEVTVDGKTKKIDLSSDMTVNQFVNRLKESGVNASFDEKNQRFFISAKTSGEEGDFSLSASNAEAITSLKSLGLYAVTDAEIAKYTKDAAIDVDAATAEALAAQKTAYTTVDAEKTNLTKQQESLTKEQKNLASQIEYLTAKAEYLKLNYNITTEEVLDEEGNPVLDDEGNPTTREVVSFASENEKADKFAAVEEEIKNLEAELEAETDETKKATIQNKLKAAKEAAAVLGNDVLTAADIKKSADAIDTQLTKTTEQYNTTTDKLNETVAALATDESLQAYVDAKNAEIDTQNAELETKLRDYYTNLKATAQNVLDTYQTDAAAQSAVRIVGQDSIIELNGAEFTSNTNSFDINGLTIQATSVTRKAGAPEDSMNSDDFDAVTITTDTDIDGIYNMIKDFFKDYNELIKSMDEAYNATSAKQYEPLTDLEKEAMTDDQIEKWEQKIKDALLRKDGTLGSLSSTMKTIMTQGITVGDERLSLASFGIKTAGYFASGDNEKGVFHIDGDADDSTSSGNADKLRAAIASDPDKVVDFFSKLSANLYNKLTDKMASSSLSSAYTVYNDKQMKTQYNNYKSEIADWEDKITAYEDRYYRQFAAMEKALASLNSQTSQLSGLFG